MSNNSLRFADLKKRDEKECWHTKTVTPHLTSYKKNYSQENFNKREKFKTL